MISFSFNLGGRDFYWLRVAGIGGCFTSLELFSAAFFLVILGGAQLGEGESFVCFSWFK